jgi:hypothetical protein
MKYLAILFILFPLIAFAQTKPTGNVDDVLKGDDKVDTGPGKDYGNKPMDTGPGKDFGKQETLIRPFIYVCTGNSFDPNEKVVCYSNGVKHITGQTLDRVAKYYRLISVVRDKQYIYFFEPR